MVTIKFPDRKTQDEAVGFLASRFSGRLFRSGEVIIPEEALGGSGTRKLLVHSYWQGNL